MRRFSRRPAGLLGLVAGLSLVVLAGCQESHPTSSPEDTRPVAVATPQPGPTVSPEPSGVPGVPPPPRDLPGGSEPPSGAGSGSGITIEIHSTAFSPKSASVELGQEVRWHNDDDVTHGAKSFTPGLFDTGPIDPDDTSSPVTMRQTGTFSYHCPLHPGKTGTLTVTEPVNLR